MHKVCQIVYKFLSNPLIEFVLDLDNTWLCEQDKKQLADWRSQFVNDNDRLLTENGKQQIRQLGNRMKFRLSELFETIDLNQQIYVRSTNTNRTVQSAIEYLREFLSFWPFKPRVNYETNSDLDYLLNFALICPRYLKVF